MDVSLLEISFGCGVLLSSQSDKTILKEVSLEWLEASDNDVYPQIILVPSQQMRIGEILGHQVAISLVDCVFLANDLDSSSTTRGCRLQNVHVLKIIHLSVIHPPLVILWEDVSWRSDLIVFAMLSPLLLHISPHVSL